METRGSRVSKIRADTFLSASEDWSDMCQICVLDTRFRRDEVFLRVVWVVLGGGKGGMSQIVARAMVRSQDKRKREPQTLHMGFVSIALECRIGAKSDALVFGVLKQSMPDP